MGELKNAGVDLKTASGYALDLNKQEPLDIKTGIVA